MKDKVTVVTVTYNAADCIEETILSVIGQTYPNIEYIVVDGKSIDCTLDLVNKHSKEISKIISEKDRGIFDAMNKGISYATGDWIIFMNAGDTFYDEQVIEKCFRNPIPENVGVVYGNTKTQPRMFRMTPFLKRPNSLCPMGICHQSLFTRTKLAKRYQFDENYKLAADYKMVRSIYEEGWEFLFVDEFISIYNTDGVSANNPLNQLKEVARICHKENSFIFYLQFLKLELKRVLVKLHLL